MMKTKSSRKIYMNYKLNIDKENNLLEVKVKLQRRTNGASKRIRVNTKHITEMVEREFVCPRDFKLGSCLSSPGMELDNDFDKKCTATWQFELLDQKLKKVEKASKKRTTTSKKKTQKNDK